MKPSAAEEEEAQMAPSTMVDRIAEYAGDVRFEAVPEDVKAIMKRHLIDALGCAAAGLDSEPARIARSLAADARPAGAGATLLGSGVPATPEWATFANGVAVRYLDFNDTYTGMELGHPSDMFAPLLAVGEAVNADGRRFIEAAVVAYEVFCRLADAVNLRARGFDYVILKAIAAAAATAKLQGLSTEQTREAVSLAAAANVGLFQTRLGDVAMWKGCASANACRNAVVAARLAGLGMTGPRQVFEGEAGFFRAVSGAPFDVDFDPDVYRCRETSLKQFPLGYLGQTPLEAALEARSKMPPGAGIESVHVETCPAAIGIMAGDDQKWDPKDRETADHSIPYGVAVALTFGEVGVAHFDEPTLSHPEVRETLKKVRVTASDEADALWPEAMLTALTLRTDDGAETHTRVTYNKGHWKNPMTDAEVEEKFWSLAGDVIPRERGEAVLDGVRSLESLESVGAIAEALRV